MGVLRCPHCGCEIHGAGTSKCPNCEEYPFNRHENSRQITAPLPHPRRESVAALARRLIAELKETHHFR